MSVCCVLERELYLINTEYITNLSVQQALCLVPVYLLQLSYGEYICASNCFKQECPYFHSFSRNELWLPGHPDPTAG